MIARLPRPLIAIAALVFAATLPVACTGLRAHRAEAPAPAPAPAAMPAATPSGVALHHPQPQLYTAGQPAAGDWAAIAGGGVGTVIDLRAPGERKDRDERAEVEAAGLRYVALPIAGHEGVTEDNAKALADLIAAAQGPVLVHCASGNRAGGLLALALAAQGVPVAQALETGRAAGMTSTETQVRQVLDAQAKAACAAEGRDATACGAGG